MYLIEYYYALIIFIRKDVILKIRTTLITVPLFTISTHIKYSKYGCIHSFGSISNLFHISSIKINKKNCLFLSFIFQNDIIKDYFWQRLTLIF